MTRYTLTLATVLFGMTAGLRADNRVLAAGSPPLTADMTARAQHFFEWILDAQFTPAQAAEYERLQVQAWQNASRRQSMLELVKNTEKIDSLPADRRASFHEKMQRTMLDSMRQQPQDPEAKLMLAVYEAAHASAAPPQPLTGSADTQVVGKWRATHTAATQYRNSVTGANAAPSGSSFAYDFRPDGTYSFSGLLQVTTYGCTSMVNTETVGTYQASGGRLEIQPTRGTVRSQMCGGSLKENPDKLEHMSRKYRLERDSNGTENLVISDLAGSNRPDFFRREKQ